jgi:hypothetical protein
LKAVVAEHDAAGGNRGEDGCQISHVLPAVHAHLKILPMETGEHERNGGPGRHDQLEKRDSAVGACKNLHAPEIDQEINHHQNGGDR